MRPLTWFARGLRPLWHLASRYPLIFLPLAAFFALHWGLLLAGFDAVHVLWSDAPWTCVLTGDAISVLCGGAITAVWWLDCCRARESNPPQEKPESHPYVAAWVLLCLFAMAPALARSSIFETTITAFDGTTELETDTYPKSVALLGIHKSRLCLPLGVSLGLVLGLLGYAYASSHPINRVWLWRMGWYPPIAVAVGYVVISLIHWFHPSFYIPSFSAPLTGLLLLGLVITVAALLHRFGQAQSTGPVFYPVLFSLAILFVVVGGIFEPVHKVPGLDGYYDKPVADRPRLDEYTTKHRFNPGGPPDRALIRDLAALDAWSTRPGNSAGPVLVVSVSGGASTSAVFVALSLFNLEAHYPGITERIRVITGASGGMLGAAYFVTQFRPGSPYRWDVRAEGFKQFFAADNEHKALAFRLAYEQYQSRLASGSSEKREEEQAYWDGMREMEEHYIEGLTADFLSPIFQKWVHKDLNPITRFFPMETANDRGTALELAWNRHLLGRPIRIDGEIPVGKVSWDPTRPSMDIPFAELRDEEARGLIPSLVFTPMMVEDGRQLIISNLDLGYMIAWGSYTAPESPNYINLTNDSTDPKTPKPTLSAVEFYRLFPEAVDTFRLCTAVRLNATFPVFTPAAELPTNPPRRVVDAGYFDNYGLLVAARWIDANRVEWFDRPVAGGNRKRQVWVVQLWTYGYDEQSSSLVTAREKVLLDEDATQPAIPDAGLRSSSLPVGGLFAAWDASMVYRGDERLNTLLYDMNLARHDAIPREEPHAYRFRKDIKNANLPMNWVLCRRSLAQLAKESRDFTELANAVLDQQSTGTAEMTAVPESYRQKLEEQISGKKFGDLPLSTQAGFREKTNFADSLFKLYSKVDHGKKLPAKKSP